MRVHAWEHYVLIGVRLLAAVALAVFCMLIEPMVAGDALRQAQGKAGDVVINEVMWDGEEYIELYNLSGEEVSLEGWGLTRQQEGKEIKVIKEFEDGDVIEAGGYSLVTSLTLVNGGELVVLWDDLETEVDRANSLSGGWLAGENTDAGVSMERTDVTLDGGSAEAWHTSTGFVDDRYGTPGQANSEPRVNIAPVAAISGPAEALVGEEVAFSGSDSMDEDGDELSFVWLFGDGDSEAGEEVAHEYRSAGTFEVVLTVSDEELEDEARLTVTVTEPSYSDQIVINEFLANPEGSDTDNEFIELRNLGDEVVDLAGWQLDDEDGGSSPHTIGDGEISGGGLLVFDRGGTKLALNNSGDTVRLINPAGEVVSSFSYDESVGEGISYSRNDNGDMVLSTTVTKGEPNVIIEPVDEEEEDEDDEDSEEEAGSNGVEGGDMKKIDLENIRDEEVGSNIQTTGVVSVPPGVFGKNYLYLAGSGSQVYFSKGAYPDLQLGDMVDVAGAVSYSRGETRIKLAQAGDIKKVKSGEAPKPHPVATGDIDEAMEGWLVTVQGEVTDTSGATFYIDDGSGEVKIYIKPTTGIKKPRMSKGDKVTITGVVSETSSGYRVLPRFQEDVRLGLVAGLTSFPVTGRRSAFGESYGPQAGLIGGWRDSLGLVGLSLGLVMVLIIMAQENREPLLLVSSK